MNRSFSQWIIEIGLIGLLLFPLIVLLWHFNQVQLTFAPELLEVLVVTTAQAALSATLTLAFGCIGAAGLLWLRARRLPYALVLGLVLLPSSAPVLLLLLAVVPHLPWVRGLTGIVFIHVLLNVGLVSFAIANLVQLKLRSLAELAWIENSSRTRFALQVAWPLLCRDLGGVFLFVFAFCFTSFAVPLALGGAQATTLEVLIYQKIRIFNAWPEAIGLAFLQIGFLFVAAGWLRREKNPQRAQTGGAVPLLELSWGWIVALIPPIILVVGLAVDLLRSSRELSELFSDSATWLNLFWGSMVIGMGTGFATVILLLLLCYCVPNSVSQKLWRGFVAPSSVLTGFAMLICFRSFGLATYFKIIAAISVTVLPVFYRFELESLLSALSAQMVMAQTLGATPSMVFLRVTFPQVIRRVCFLGGLASVWAWGDFSFSTVLAERNVSLAMQVRAMMESYRFHGAMATATVAIGGGLLTLGLFVGAGHVLGAQSQS